MAKITVRSAKLEEVRTLQDLNDEIFINNWKYDDDLRRDWAQSEDGGKEYFTELLKNPNSICLFAEDWGKIVGYVAASPKEIRYRNSRYIEIENMGVIPEYHSLGIGKMLMEECLRIAKDRGFQKVMVNTYSKNVEALEFYKRNGFLEIDISLEKMI